MREGDKRGVWTDGRRPATSKLIVVLLGGASTYLQLTGLPLRIMGVVTRAKRQKSIAVLQGGTSDYLQLTGIFLVSKRPLELIGKNLFPLWSVRGQ